MGGSIRLISEPGVGSSFVIDLRLRKQATPAAPGLPAGRFAGKTVLLVDASATSRQVLRDPFVRLGCRVIEAARGAEISAGLASPATTETPDMVLLGQQVQDTSGALLAADLQAVRAAIAAPVVLIAPTGPAKDPASARARGFAAILSKPVRQSELWRVTVNLLGVPGGHMDEEAGLREPFLIPAIQHDLRVLVVEDNAVNQKVARRLLERHGCQVETAANGLEAIEALAGSRYDLVLMDVQMPEMDGLAATEEIRRREAAQGGHVPIIAMTAHAMKGDRDRCLRAGMDDYISKPIDIQALLAALEKWGRSSCERDAA
jgi:CheY-like chemotaxis protein